MEVRNLIVPVDFSECANAALARAMMMAKQYGAPIHLIHGVEAVQYPTQFHVPASFKKELEEAAAADLRARVEEVERAGCVATQSVAFGHPTKIICDEAKRYDNALIVMGTHGFTGIERAIMGSVAERTVRFAPCPVLTVREAAPDRETPFRRVLVCTDFSPDAEFATAVAIGLCEDFGAELHLAYALHLRPPTIPELVLPESYFIEDAREVASARLNGVFERVAAAGLEGAPHLIEGDASKAIIAFVETSRPDLIVLGTRGHTGLKHLVSLGSVAERVIRGADCSVLVTKLPGD